MHTDADRPRFSRLKHVPTNIHILMNMINSPVMYSFLAAPWYAVAFPPHQ